MYNGNSDKALVHEGNRCVQLASDAVKDLTQRFISQRKGLQKDLTGEHVFVSAFCLTQKYTADIMECMSLQRGKNPETVDDALLWRVVKSRGQDDMNMKRFPVLETPEGAVLGECGAIEFFVGNRFGLFGQSDIEQAQVIMICEHLADIRKNYQDAKKKEKEEEGSVAKWFKETLPEWMSKLEFCLGAKGFAVGEKLSLADVRIFHFVKDYFDNKEGAAAGIAACPKITASVAAVESNQGIKDYLAARKPTTM
jgi:glutathione S-transferase